MHSLKETCPAILETAPHPATRAELVVALEHGIAITSQRRIDPALLAAPLPAPAVDPELLLIWVAGVLQEPIEAARIVRGVGRFALIHYTPVAQPDPDLVIALTPGARDFHQAILHFQKARRAWPGRDWAAWYRQAMRAARQIVPPLQALVPHPLEADFVLRWALLACATGSRPA